MISPEPAALDTRLPVTLITGFLGSGKTTLLNGLLQDPGFAGSLVIINEFGEIGIDHLLVSTPAENMRLLANGCLCCAVRGDLVDTLADAFRLRRDAAIQPFERVLVETSGLADPVPIIQTVVTDEALATCYRLDTVVTLVDCVHAQGQLDTHPEAIKQVAVADLLLLTKTDIAESSGVDAVIARLRNLNAGIEILEVVRGRLDPVHLFGRAVPQPHAGADEIERWLGAGLKSAFPSPPAPLPEGEGSVVLPSPPGSGIEGEGRRALGSHEHCEHAAHATHDDRVRSFTLYHDQVASAQSLTAWLTLLASFRGANLLRVKGLINVEGRPVVVQAVQTVIHEPVELAQWPTGDRRSRVVFIVRDADRAQFENVLAALSSCGGQVASAPVGKNLLDPQAYAQFVALAKTLR